MALVSTDTVPVALIGFPGVASLLVSEGHVCHQPRNGVRV